MKIYRASLVMIGGLIGTLLSPTVSADLIATISFGGTSGGGSVNPIGDVSGGGLALFFGSLTHPSACIGCSPYLSNGTAQTVVEFSRANSLDFDGFVTRLTDSQDETLQTGFILYGADRLIGGGAAGSPESLLLSTLLLTPDIVVTIDSIRLNINTFRLESSEFAWSASYGGTFEIFGTPGSAFEGPYQREPASVPEPAAMSLIAFGLLMTAAVRRKRTYIKGTVARDDASSRVFSAST